MLCICRRICNTLDLLQSLYWNFDTIPYIIMKFQRNSLNIGVEKMFFFFYMFVEQN